MNAAEEMYITSEGRATAITQSLKDDGRLVKMPHAIE